MIQPDLNITVTCKDIMDGLPYYKAVVDASRLVAASTDVESRWGAIEVLLAAVSSLESWERRSEKTSPKQKKRRSRVPPAYVTRLREGNKAYDAIDTLRCKLDRDPSKRELANYLGVSEDLVESLDAWKNRAKNVRIV